MKRYLYILLVAALALVSCDTIFHTETRPDVVFNFGSVEVVTTENSATVNAAKPSITVDGVEEQGVAINLEYWTATDESDLVAVDEFEQNGGRIIFSIDSLQPSTEYRARLVVRGEYGDGRSGIFPIVTLQHIPVAEYSCECQVDPKGIYADIKLSNVAFTLDGVEQSLAKVEFKYSQSMSAGQWTAVELTSEDIANGFRIPAEGGEYLQVKSTYNYVVTLTPEDSRYEEYTVKDKFTTIEAVLSAENLCDPKISTTEECLTLSCVKPTLLVDDVEIPGYADVKYLFYFTDDNDHHGTIEADVVDGNMSVTVPFSEFIEGATYSFCTRMDINDTNVMDSDYVQFTMPVNETPAPPAPPVSGDADTSELAGEWKLTEWRGSVPSFDVYLSITEDGVVSLFQRMESRLWEIFYSLVGYENGIIAGEYTDGVVWAHSYYVTLSGNTMTWISTTDSSEVSVYTRCTLPDVTNPEIRTYANS